MYIKHGLSRHLLYRVWANMQRRCYDKKDLAYASYGGRGIFICTAWQDFEVFYKFCMLKGWKKGLQIDRIDNNLGYFPVNCCFVTQKINSQNKKRSMIWHINGFVFNSSIDAGKYFGVHNATIGRWCHGRKSGRYTQFPKSDCWTEQLYKNEN